LPLVHEVLHRPPGGGPADDLDVESGDLRKDCIDLFDRGPHLLVGADGYLAHPGHGLVEALLKGAGVAQQFLPLGQAFRVGREVAEGAEEVAHRFVQGPTDQGVEDAFDPGQDRVGGVQPAQFPGLVGQLGLQEAVPQRRDRRNGGTSADGPERRDRRIDGALNRLLPGKSGGVNVGDVVPGDLQRYARGVQTGNA
jgi:hypothetical protein